MKIILETENINFVSLSTSLVNDYLKMINDPEIQKLISTKTKIFTEEDEKIWVASKLAENAICYSLIEKSTNEFIGNIEMMDIQNNKGTLGISLTPDKQDKHYGTEAITAFVKYAFEELNLDTIDLTVFKTNERAIHCYEKIGFKKSKEKETEKEYYMILTK